MIIILPPLRKKTQQLGLTFRSISLTKKTSEGELSKTFKSITF